MAGKEREEVSLWVLSSGGRLWDRTRLVVLAVAEHGEQHVAAASGEADQRGVVFLALGAFALVVGLAFGQCHLVKLRGSGFRLLVAPCEPYQREWLF